MSSDDRSLDNMQVPAGITENDIAEYLANAPGFFDRHSDVLAAIQLPSLHAGRAVSLHERQMEIQRERYRALEAKLYEMHQSRLEMIRAGEENMEISRRMHRWVCAVMLARQASLLGQVLIEELKHQFLVPQAALRVWGVASAHQQLPWAREVSEEVRTFAASLPQPYCGPNQDFEAARWLADPQAAASIALVPLRLGRSEAECFGLLVLASADPNRYQLDMGTEFLQQVGDVASAALGRLLVAEAPPELAAEAVNGTAAGTATGTATLAVVQPLVNPAAHLATAADAEAESPAAQAAAEAIAAEPAAKGGEPSVSLASPADPANY